MRSTRDPGARRRSSADILPEGPRPAGAPPTPALGNAAMARLLGGHPVARQAAPGSQGRLDPTTASAIAAERSSGQAIPDGVRTDLEHTLGFDFSAVRLHTGPRADALSRAVAAQAFTSGTDVFFRQGRYDPGDPVGRGLLAHELTHVVQQATGTAGRDGGISQPTDPAEVQASEAARAYVARSAAPDATVAQAAADGPAHAAGGPPPARAGARTPTALLGLQRQAGNAAVAQLMRAGGPVVQRCGPVPCDCPSPSAEGTDMLVQRDGPTAPAPAVAPAPLPVTRPQLIGPLLEEWRAAGLLDAPFRPPEVGAIPPLTDPRQAASPPGPAGDGGGSGPVSPAFLGPVPPVTVPGPQAPPVTVPAPGRPPMPGPALIPPWLAGIAVFLTVLLTPTETAPPWMDELNPITGGPYGSPEEYLWTRQLTAAQQDYLRYLSRARRLRPDAAADGDVDPRVLPQPEPAPDPDRSATCFGTDVPRKGGHARHDAYATKVTQSVNDYFVRTPESLKINYDGLLRPATVWEVKVGYGWFFNPELAGVRDARLAQWDVQKNVGLAIAARCGYVHLWAHPDRHVAQLLTARWGGAPPVLNIPE